MMTSYLTTRDVCDILKLSDVSTVTRFIRQKLLKARYIGTKWLVAPADLQAFVDAAPTADNKRGRSNGGR